MTVRDKTLANPPSLNTSALAPDVLETVRGKKTSFVYSVPRENAITYCENYNSAKNKMQKMLEVRPTSTPKTTSMVYMTASNKACKSHKQINSKTVIQQTVMLVDRPRFSYVINCPGGESVCYVYMIQPESFDNKSHRRSLQNTLLEDSASSVGDNIFSLSHGRKALCTANNFVCQQDGDCCTNYCITEVSRCSCKGDEERCSSDSQCCSGYNCRLAIGYYACQKCFPGNAMVELADGRSIPFSKLRLGDHIKVVSSSGDVKAETALFWLHNEPNRHAAFLNIQAVSPETNAISSLRISGNHFLLASTAGAQGVVPSFAEAFMAPAKDVQPGWWIWVKSRGDSSEVTPAQVVRSTPELLRGVYSILTESGTVMVDGVAASNHADMVMKDGSLLSEVFVSKKNIPALHHAFLAPVRLVAKVLGSKAMEAAALTSPLALEGSVTVSLGHLLYNAVAWFKGVH